MLDFQDREHQIDYSRNHLILTTYETLRELQLSFGRVAWSAMILDEAQKIKNPATRTSVAARAMNCDFGLALTGTPVENSWTDLWTIMDFVEPGKLESLKDFNNHYQHQLQNVENKGELLKELGDQLRKNLDPCFIRRLKEDVNLGLPAKEILRFKDPMPEEQRKLYEVLDLGFGKCRMCVCGPQSAAELLKHHEQIRVATKYPHIAKDYFYNKKHQTVEIVKLNGSIELAPIVGLSDVIVDIVETGSTLRENGLVVLEEICPLSARVVVNQVSMRMENERITKILTDLKSVIKQEA